MRYEIALNLFRDFSTGNYQITIFFNRLIFLYNAREKTVCPVSALKLLYTSSYEIVINDARYVLLNYEQNGKFELGKLNYSDFMIEEAIMLHLSEEDRGKVVVEIDGKQYLVISDSVRMDKIPFNKGWMPRETK